VRFYAWLSSIFEPSEFNNLNLDELMGCLLDSDVRKHWLNAVLEEIKDANMRTHVALINGNLTDKFVQESARLQGIDWVLRQILNSKNSVSMARHHNRQADPLEGTAVQRID
jgi:hypothetical protein